jgi:hypothetical protein
MLRGGCLCGAIRYQMEGPAGVAAVCHCRNCQKQSGSAFSVLVGARASALRVEGQTAVYHDRGDSGAAVDRHFCAACGSPIYSSLPAAPEVVYIKAGTLDDTARLAPRVHVWCDSAWPWTAFPEGAVRIARNPPAAPA